ncbi:hypothetical protein BBI09_09770 [Stutzerimonas xanthomarina]|nr:hypothetical protein BBI09_09770 [Stutzerimonas xanthomarina]
MYGTLTNFLINGIISREIDDKPDIFQSVLSKLGELTETEVTILGKMQQLGLWGDDGPQGFDTSRQLEEWVAETVGVNQAAAQGIISGIQRSGLIQVKPVTWAGNDLNYRLTGLARYLLDLIHYEHKL